jgi:hypothetical protein
VPEDEEGTVAVLAHFGTFDVENYGDLLLAAILERRLVDLGHGFVHVSPHGCPPVWDDCVPTVAAGAIIADPPDLAKAVIEAIGYFDERSSPDGYGEEVDYCLRATKAGFDLAVADHAYVCHAANRNYGPDRRAALKAASRAAHLHKHKAKRIRAAITKSAEEPTLAMMREAVAEALR